MLPNSKTLFFTALLSAGLLASPVFACGEKGDDPAMIKALHDAQDEIKMLKLAAAEEEGKQRGMPPGFEEAATKLGVSADTLFQTMNAAGGPRADLEKVAQQLGVSQLALKEALPLPPKHQ